MSGDEPDWLRLQKKIFGRYVQQRLREAGLKQYTVRNIVEDLKDGVMLIEVMQVLSGEQFSTKYGKMPEPTTIKIKQVDAVNKALQFTADCGVDLKKIRISGEDIVNGREKEVLALVFQLIIKYLKIDEDDDGTSASMDIREALMLWIKNKCAGFDSIEIENFTKSFHDGMVFNALIARMRPKLVDFASLSPGNADANLKQALDIGERYMNVEQYVTPSDIAKLDELGMIVYLSDWYNGVVLLQKQDVAARRIGKLVDMTILHDNMRADYTAQAMSLYEWVTTRIDLLDKREFDDTMDGIRQLLDDFYAYKAGDKVAAVMRLMDADALYNNLALRLGAAQRPPFKPLLQGYVPGAIGHGGSDDESEEEEEGGDTLGASSSSSSSSLPYAKVVDDEPELGSRECSFMEGEQSFLAMMAQNPARVTRGRSDANEEVDKLAGSVQLKQASGKKITKKQAWTDVATKFSYDGGLAPASLESLFRACDKAEGRRAKALHEELARQVRLQKVMKRLEGQSRKLQTWSTQKRAFIDGLAVEDIDSVYQAEEALDALRFSDREVAQITPDALTDARAAVDDLRRERFEFVDDAAALYSSLMTSFDMLVSVSADKMAELENELTQQKATNQRLFQAFASSAFSFSLWLEKQKQTLKDTSVELQVQLEHVQRCIRDDDAAAERLVSDLRKCDDACNARSLVNNPFTTVTLNDVDALVAQYKMSLQKKQALLEERISEQERAGLTEAQMAEIHENFEYFDRDKGGCLNKRELKTCLQSLGEESTAADIKAIMEAHDKDGSGTVTMDEFVELMKDRLGDTDTQEEIECGFNLLSLDNPIIRATQLENVVNDKSFKDAHVTYLTTEMTPADDGYTFTEWNAAAFAR